MLSAARRPRDAAERGGRGINGSAIMVQTGYMFDWPDGSVRPFSFAQKAGVRDGRRPKGGRDEGDIYLIIPVGMAGMLLLVGSGGRSLPLRVKNNQSCLPAFQQMIGSVLSRSLSMMPKKSAISGSSSSSGTL